MKVSWLGFMVYGLGFRVVNVVNVVRVARVVILLTTPYYFNTTLKTGLCPNNSPSAL